MRSQRPLVGLTLGVLICIGSAGCAVNSSIAKRSPVRRSDNVAPQRLLAIAKVFEQQGHIDRAASMYERVLAQDPSSMQARSAIAHIASMSHPRDFRGDQPVVSENRGEVQLANTSDINTQPVQPIVGSKLIPVPTQELVVRTVRPPEVPGILEVPTVSPKPVLETTMSVVAEAVDTSTQVVPLVASAPEQLTSANRLVSLEEVRHQAASAAEVMAGLANANDSNVDVLLHVLNYNDDPERRAVAAALLAEVPAGDLRVDSALDQHCMHDVALVSSAACESLLARGLVSNDMIQVLLSLSGHSDAGIRSQVTVSLRRLAGTPWEDDVVQASLMRLDDTSPTVRGLASLTLSEFSRRSEMILERLVERYDLETDPSVRGSLELAAERIASLAIDEGMPLPFAE